ncbi:type IV pilus assembly protein PilA [Thermodesulfitimonas autotrophica]|uniref:Type IV pilus assembly protein PilA n=1 Tax=Thermodesulfitimonas autotrophica TaxID=1894989 RepID=A0A3N5BNH8_9THEO|nr:prepilin-type N-terminal cleavage/methylation domain-containing protein [Thermodesulfitimonas autotrophica]RPF49222.1 type IV pilus assembly protein PilA [Thermodesulfitimonas autotrophica]
MLLRLAERMRRLRADERGFTLIELLVVVVIIGVLVGIALPRFLGQADKAKEKAALSDLRAMKSVLEVYIADEGNGVAPANTYAQAVLENGGIKNKKDPWAGSYYYLKGTSDDQYEIYCQHGTTYYYVSDASEPTSGTAPPYGTTGAQKLWP